MLKKNVSLKIKISYQEVKHGFDHVIVVTDPVVGSDCVYSQFHHPHGAWVS
jgi:hypothetical protein